MIYHDQLRTELEARHEVAVQIGITIVMGRIHERFEETPNPMDQLTFHNTDHANNVDKRGEIITLAIKRKAPFLLSPHQQRTSRLRRKGHDLVQEGHPEEEIVNGLKRVKRKRHVVDNERDTAGELDDIMDDVNEQLGEEHFTNDDKAANHEGLDVTIPEYHPALKTVIQPYLTKETSPEARILALADLAGPGIGGPKVFRIEGDTLFREEQLDILAAFLSGEPIPGSYQEFFKTRVVDWTGSQADFARGRQKRLPEELIGFPEVVISAVMDVFDQFENSIAAVEALAKQRAKMSFKEVMLDIGYPHKLLNSFPI